MDNASLTANVITNTWGTFTFDFVAASSATPLTIIGTATAGGQYIGVDNVSVQPHVVPFLITSFNRINPSDLRLGFNSQTGKIYAVQSRADLIAGNWITVPGTTNTGNGSTLFVTLTNGVSGPRLFFLAHEFAFLSRGFYKHSGRMPSGSDKPDSFAAGAQFPPTLWSVVL